MLQELYPNVKRFYGIGPYAVVPEAIRWLDEVTNGIWTDQCAWSRGLPALHSEILIDRYWRNNTVFNPPAKAKQPDNLLCHRSARVRMILGIERLYVRGHLRPTKPVLEAFLELDRDLIRSLVGRGLRDGNPSKRMTESGAAAPHEEMERNV